MGRKHYDRDPAVLRSCGGAPGPRYHVRCGSTPCHRVCCTPPHFSAQVPLLLGPCLRTSLLLIANQRIRRKALHPHLSFGEVFIRASQLAGMPC